MWKLRHNLSWLHSGRRMKLLGKCHVIFLCKRDGAFSVHNVNFRLFTLRWLTSCTASNVPWPLARYQVQFCNKVGLDRVKRRASVFFLSSSLALRPIIIRLLFICNFSFLVGDYYTDCPNKFFSLYTYVRTTKPHLCVIRPFDFAPKFSPFFSFFYPPSPEEGVPPLGYFGVHWPSLLRCWEKMWSVTKLLPQPPKNSSPDRWGTRRARFVVSLFPSSFTFFFLFRLFCFGVFKGKEREGKKQVFLTSSYYSFFFFCLPPSVSFSLFVFFLL